MSASCHIAGTSGPLRGRSVPARRVRAGEPHERPPRQRSEKRVRAERYQHNAALSGWVDGEQYPPSMIRTSRTPPASSYVVNWFQSGPGSENEDLSEITWCPGCHGLREPGAQRGGRGRQPPGPSKALISSPGPASLPGPGVLTFASPALTWAHHRCGCDRLAVRLGR